MVMQGRKRVKIGSVEYLYDPYHYLVVRRSMRFQWEVLEASSARPFLSLVLQLPVNIVTEILQLLAPSLGSVGMHEQGLDGDPAYVSAMDYRLLDAMKRFLLSLSSEPERIVLAPLYLREIIYHLLQSEQRQRLLTLVNSSSLGAVTAAIQFMEENLHRPLTLESVAEAVCLSPSGLAHLFKSTIGVPPMRFLRRLRMERAAKLLQQGFTASQTAASIGCSSLPHFSSQFKRYFGKPPRAFLSAYREMGLCAIREQAGIRQQQRRRDSRAAAPLASVQGIATSGQTEKS
jgi:AraC-like DNA-binding protein